MGELSMSTKRSTKIAIASALAASAIVPAVAVQAETKYADGEYTVQADISNALVASAVENPVSIIVKDGKFIAKMPLNATTKSYINSATVDGVNALNGSELYFEFTELKTFNVSANVKMPFGLQKGEVVDLNFTIKLDPSTFQPKTSSSAPSTGAPTTEAPATPTATKLFKPGSVGQIVDGTYDAEFDAYKIEADKATGNYTAITSHFEPAFKLIVKDGKTFAQIKVKETSNAMVAGFKVTDAAGKETAATLVSGSPTGAQQVFEFPIDSVNSLTKAAVHVVVAEHNMDKWYDFGFGVETKKLAATQKSTVTTYKNGTNEVSIMNGQYLATDITYTPVNGQYEVDLTFPQGQYLNEVKFEGQTVAAKSSTASGTNTVKVYTVKVPNLTDIYNASFDLTVAAGPVNYNAVHTVQLQFGGKKNPFTDITKLSNYGKIVSLYSAGIYKENTKFNPYGKVNRSQFALMLQRALSYNVPAGASAFADVNSIKDVETVNAIKALSAQNVIKGSNGAFNPYGEIRRDQAAQMIYRVLVANGYQEQGVVAPFADTLALGEEAQIAIAELNVLGIMTGSQGKFNPKNTLTRDQMSKVLANTLQVIENL